MPRTNSDQRSYGSPPIGFVRLFFKQVNVVKQSFHWPMSLPHPCFSSHVPTLVAPASLSYCATRLHLVTHFARWRGRYLYPCQGTTSFSGSCTQWALQPSPLNPAFGEHSPTQKCGYLPCHPLPSPCFAPLAARAQRSASGLSCGPRTAQVLMRKWL